MPAALRDLDRLHGFLRLHNPDAANRALDAIRTAAMTIPAHPELGRPYESALEFRELIVPFGRRSYVIRYRLLEGTVYVVRVWHALGERT